MVVGICKIRFAIRQSRSLKDKRQVLRRLKDRMKSKFNISVAEVDSHDYHQTADLGLAVAAADATHASSQIQAAVNFVSMEVEVLDVSTEIVHL
ncbi:MAG: DUF503 domain-containing protein [Nitrospinota bacterium]|nr:DUF503 domain-containing protein [Nitrospinota bacterium]